MSYKAGIGVLLAALAACAGQAPEQRPAAPGAPQDEARAAPEPDLGILWVRDAAEWRALALQAYTSATKDLPNMLMETTWSAIPGQEGAAGLPPAIIFDVDETLVSNVEFQVQLEPPFTDARLNEWNAANEARPVPGAADFVQLAREMGVQPFFITNRPCEARDSDPCPQKAVTIDDLNEAGIPADPDEVMMAGERPEWTQEKLTRRAVVADSYRVIMLIGDDLGDFLPCMRGRIVAPCIEAGTRESRAALTQRYAAYWGNGWYVLPNPMHGSWTSAR